METFKNIIEYLSLLFGVLLALQAIVRLVNLFQQGISFFHVHPGM